VKILRTSAALAAAAAVALTGCQAGDDTATTRQNAAPAAATSAATASPTATSSPTETTSSTSRPTPTVVETGIEEVSSPATAAPSTDAAAKASADKLKADKLKAKKKASTTAKKRAAVTKKKVTAKKAAKKATAPAKKTTPKASAKKAPAKKVTGPTNWAALNSAIARIPGYRPGVAHWYVTAKYGHYGATDLSNGNIYISPNVPTNLLYSVAAHEYSHALITRNYGYKWTTANTALNRVFGGGGNTAQERAADCMAKRLGASWTHYTSCTNSSWRTAAGTLLQGREL